MSERFRREDGLPTIGLALIAKNEEEQLPKLLDSLGWAEPETDPRNANAKSREGFIPEGPERKTGPARNSGFWRTAPAVDFVVVCDTGSEDATKEVAGRRGCRVVEFDWIDDFSAARQASYDALPSVDFTLWADCDDLIENAALLRQVAAGMPSEVAGTMHRYNYAQDQDGNCICELWRERLVRQEAAGDWKLPVHEVLEVAGQLANSGDVVWIHTHPPERERIPERNYHILSTDLQRSLAAGELPSVRTLAYLGTEALALGRPEEAVDLFREYLARPDTPWDQERCQVAHKLSIALRAPREGESEQSEDYRARLELAEEAGLRAITERSDWADGYVDLAEIALRREQPEQALRFCDTALRLDPPQTLLIINPMEYGYQPEIMRSISLFKLGRIEEAWEATQRCLSITPGRDDLLAQAEALRGLLATAEAERHLLSLREILVRFDENEKAMALLDAAPYFLRERPAVAQARLDQREMTLHATEPEVYGSYYRENPGEAPFEMQGVPIPKAHEAFHRVKMLREGLDQQAGYGEGKTKAEAAKETAERRASLRILDLSANDGWMLANLAEGGYGTSGAGALDGMDLNRGAVERALERPQLRDLGDEFVCDDLFNAPEHFREGSYDAVVCFETIEHVPDPEALLDLMARMAKPAGVQGDGGRLYLSTPDGAFERGAIPAWSRVESKGHLRALPATEVAELVAPRGKVEQFERVQRLVACSITNEPRRGRIDFFLGPVEALPEKIELEGLGGSETAACKMAELFARRGYDVRVFAGNGGGLRGDHMAVGELLHTGGNVLYEPMAAWDPGAPADLFIASRLPQAFDRTIAAPRRALWLHDASYGAELTAERAARATDILVLSEFQRELLSGFYPFLAGELTVSRNGIESSYFPAEPEPLEQRKPIVVYSSSPDRGLDVLLECWPQIRKQVPEAELHHTYAPVYAEFAARDPQLAAFHAHIEQLQEGQEGIVAHGHMGQRKLAELFAAARVWAYPSWSTPTAGPFPEIYCITAVEAQAAGALPVCLDYAALRETVQRGVRVPTRRAPESYKRLPGSWRQEFVDAVVAGLTQPFDVATAWAQSQDWSGVADEWERLLLLDRERVRA